jgi:hypothetical protein
MTTDVTAERQHADEAAMVLAGMGLPLNGIQWGGALALLVTMAALAAVGTAVLTRRDVAV